MDAFDTFWRWANKDLQDHTITIPAEFHHAVALLQISSSHLDFGHVVVVKELVVCTENLNPDVVVVKSAKDGV